ncbi:hypothetical protein [Paraburkholderia sp. BL27I4N3]|uniref:hypothetical protein n=1 Tax=Paraburkholderia sp. BL27I4N3 TaxID=1938805 RepID=UPI000E250E7B|nr:hypothetical protein [Paraburkholderia sp. BL27I4N3]
MNAAFFRHARPCAARMAEKDGGRGVSDGIKRRPTALYQAWRHCIVRVADRLVPAAPDIRALIRKLLA